VSLETWELASYQLLSDNYQDFLRIALDNPDLRLFSAGASDSLSEQQREDPSFVRYVERLAASAADG
jgi:hypothetical protein